MITTNIDNGIELANMADKIRSFSRIYLEEDKPELNQISAVKNFDKNTETRICYLCNKPGHLKVDCGFDKYKNRFNNQFIQKSFQRPNQRYQTPLVPSSFAFNQGATFHRGNSACRGGPPRVNFEQQRNNSSNFRGDTSTITCFYCHKTGHKANDCFDKKNDQEPNYANGSGESFIYNRR